MWLLGEGGTVALQSLLVHLLEKSSIASWRAFGEYMQDSGTAIWLFAYFGYWVEVLIVLLIKVARGTLLHAKKKSKPLPELEPAPSPKEVSSPGTTPTPDAKAAGEHCHPARFAN
jgi:hypothetical protein